MSGVISGLEEGDGGGNFHRKPSFLLVCLYGVLGPPIGGMYFLLPVLLSAMSLPDYKGLLVTLLMSYGFGLVPALMQGISIRARRRQEGEVSFFYAVASSLIVSFVWIGIVAVLQGKVSAAALVGTALGMGPIVIGPAVMAGLTLWVIAPRLHGRAS